MLRREPCVPRARLSSVITIVACVLVVALASVRTLASGDSPPRAPSQAVLQRHVATLASPEFEGRAGAGARRAARFIIERFQDLELEPMFDGSYEQAIVGFGAPKGQVIGRNVGAFLRGSDPALRDEWVILSAHYDHLGVRGRVYPGADDNASGVAMMLEVARCLVQARGDARPRRSIAFVGFDLEENGLWGSQYFADHPPIPLEKLRLFVTADMIGRSLGGVCHEYVFVMGTEYTPGLRPMVDRASEGLALKTGVIGSDLLLFDRSDYGPFRKRKIPYLFFSTGESPVYHTPDDRPETIDYVKMTEISELVLRVVSEAVRSDAAPTWAAQAEHQTSEAVAVRDVLTRILDHATELRVNPIQAAWLRSQIDDLDQAIQRGALSPVERRRMVINAQLVLYSVL